MYTYTVYTYTMYPEVYVITIVKLGPNIQFVSYMYVVSSTILCKKLDSYSKAQYLSCFMALSYFQKSYLSLHIKPRIRK